MIVSSPSAASFRSGACSPRSNPHSHSHPHTYSYSHSHAHLHPHASASSSAATHFAASAHTSQQQQQQHSPLFTSPPTSTTSLSVAAPAAVTSSVSPRQHRRSASRSLLSHSIEELRTALKNHSVAAAASREPVPGPSGEHMSRGCMSAGPDTLGGDSRQSLTNDSNELATTNSATRIEKTQPPESESESAAVPITTTTSEAQINTSVTSVSPSDVKGKRQLAEVAEHDPSSATTAAAVAETRLPQLDGSSDQTLDRTRSKRLRPPVPAVKLLPRRYELVHPNDMVILISSMIMELIQYNDTIPLQGGKLTRFHSRTPPRISVRDYLQRLTTHATLSPPILLSMVYYIDRLCALYPAFTVSSLTVHRFLITSATVASKGLSDSFWTNKTYARVGGITITELAMLELDFLWRVEWKIVPQPEVLVDYYLSLVERCEGYALEPEDAPSADPTASAVSSDMEGVINSPPADSSTQT